MTANSPGHTPCVQINLKATEQDRHRDRHMLDTHGAMDACAVDDKQEALTEHLEDDPFTRPNTKTNQEPLHGS